MFVKPGEHYIADFTFLYHKAQYKSMTGIEFCVPRILTNISGQPIVHTSYIFINREIFLMRQLMSLNEISPVATVLWISAA